MYSTLCRIAGLAFSFALIPTYRDLARKNQSVYLCNEWTSAFNGF